jgi:cell cycle checkpoint control protein RAD9A
MVILNFTLSEEGVAVLHDALACMFKFSDDVCLEARKDKVRNAPPSRSLMVFSC